MKKVLRKKLTTTTKIKIGLILLSLLVLGAMTKDTFFNAPVDKSTSQVVPTAPVEIDAQKYFKEMNNTVDNNSTSATPKDGQKSIDKIFSALVPAQTVPVAIQPKPQQSSVSSSVVPPPTNFINQNQFPSLRASSNGGSQTFNGIPPVSELIQQNQQPTPPNINISGINCFNNECQANTNIGTLKKGDIISGNEKIEFVSMTGIKTNKRSITY